LKEESKTFFVIASPLVVEIKRIISN